MVSGSIWCVFLGLMACVFLGLMAIGGILPAVELIDAIKDGRDLFAFAIPEMQASVLPKSKIMTSVANATSNWDPRVRIGVGYLWAWGAGYAMLSAFLLIVFGFLAFWLLMFALDRGGQSPTRDYGPRDDLPEVPPVGSGHTVKAGFGGPFADVVATLDGNHVKKGHGGPLADVIATVEGNRIKKGYGGPLADVIATIEGSQIKQGYGGPFAEVIATIEGNQVKAGYGGPFSDTLYTAE
ncbi:MAG: hypothetical protein Q7T82_16435 [Armatimonadota bacterium]|nr:hypothetical protein [Armatimonadota bacterium]